MDSFPVVLPDEYTPIDNKFRLGKHGEANHKESSVTQIPATVARGRRRRSDDRDRMSTASALFWFGPTWVCDTKMLLASTGCCKVQDRATHGPNALELEARHVKNQQAGTLNPSWVSHGLIEWGLWRGAV